jgi:ABC-type uncharacterized transport system substrate-binding protein
LGNVEGQNLTAERYSGEGRPAGFADLAREVVSGNPDVIVAIGPPITLAARAAQYRSLPPGLKPAREWCRVWRDPAAT